MDKICRGSTVGDAYINNAWSESANQPERMRFARGTHVTGSSPKLENSGNSSLSHPRCSHVSDTFRSSGWFRHNEMCLSSSPTRARTPPVGKVGVATREPAAAQSSADCRQSSGRSSLRTADAPRGCDGEAQACFRAGFLRSSRSNGDLSPRDALSAPDRGRASVSRAERRAGSPTFANSEDWMGYSSPCGSPRAGVGFAGREQAGVEELMPSRNFTAGGKRQHHSRVSESTVEGIIRQDSPLPRPTTGNGAGVPGANLGGKKTNICKESDAMKRRLKLDASQAEILRSDKKREFSPPRGFDASRFHDQPVSARMRVVPPRPQPQEGRSATPVIDIQRRTSKELAAAMSPEDQEQEDAGPKYFLGREVVSGSRGVRRGARDCVQTAVRDTSPSGTPRQGGGYAEPTLAEKVVAASVRNFRDHRSSDGVQANFADVPAQSPTRPASPAAAVQRQQSEHRGAAFQQSVEEQSATPRIPLAMPTEQASQPARAGPPPQCPGAQVESRRPAQIVVQCEAVGPAPARTPQRPIAAVPVVATPLLTNAVPAVSSGFASPRGIAQAYAAAAGGAATPRAPMAGYGSNQPRSHVNDHNFVSYGAVSTLPSRMPREDGFNKGSLTVTRHIARTPGVFSPNAHRVPAVQVLPAQTVVC